MKPRSLSSWLALKPTTRHRYTNALRKAGIGDAEQFYLSGARLNVARSHSIAPEHPGRAPYIPRDYIDQAVERGVTLWVPDWDDLTTARQSQISRWFILGRHTKWSGRKLTPRERRERGLLRSDTRVMRHPSPAQEQAMLDWNALMVHYRGIAWGDGKSLAGEDDWEEYRAHYMESFA